MMVGVDSTSCIEIKYQRVNVIRSVYISPNQFWYSFEEINHVHGAIILQEGIVEVLID